MDTPSLHPVNISFVIPTYNYASYLKKCLKSICDQSVRAHEIIIVDDGSTDNTKEVVTEISERFPGINIKYYYQNNLGPSIAKNFGCKMAEGEYIWFIDSDDELLEGAIKRMIEALKENPDVGLIFSGYQTVNESGRIKYHHASQMKIDRTYNFKRYIFKKIHGLCTGSAIIHKQALQVVSFPEGVYNNEDIVFFSHVLVLYPSISVPGIILQVNHHKNSLRKDISRIKETGLKVVDSLFNKDILEPELMVFRKKFMARRNLSIFRSHYLAGEHRLAAKYYQKAIRAWPRLILKWPYLRKYLTAIFK